jgi:hypothetical protein
MRWIKKIANRFHSGSAWTQIESLTDSDVAEAEWLSHCNAQRPRWTARSLPPSGVQSYYKRKEARIRDLWPEAEFWSSPLHNRNSVRLLKGLRDSGLWKVFRAFVETHVDHMFVGLRNDVSVHNVLQLYDVFVNPLSPLARTWSDPASKEASLVVRWPLPRVIRMKHSYDE